MAFFRTYIAPFTRRMSSSIENSSIKLKVLQMVVVFGFAWLGMHTRAWLNVFGDASWKTPDMLGNSYRSPIFPHEFKPYFEDIEASVEYNRRELTLLNELTINNRLFKF